MPSLDIVTVQPSLQNHSVQLSAQTLKRSNAFLMPCKLWNLSKTANLYTGISRGNLVVTAVATLERKSLIQTNNGPNSSKLVSEPKDKNEVVNEDSERLDDRERMRRKRISKANKGNTPWNKGRKHSPETLQRIRERTKLAMQNPKIRMKLASLGHAQSEETRLKIAIGVRMKWERKREEQLVQERCHFEWQNLIAEASRKGCDGEEELEWETYKILAERFKKEFFESVKQRKTMPKPKEGIRAPKSFEQRRKIAEAIAAKWANPEYRERVCSSMAKYHGSPAGAVRTPRRSPRSRREFPNRSRPKKITAETTVVLMSPPKSKILKLQKSNKAKFRDPLASSKLNMIKNIRAERTAAESKRVQALSHARVLIAEAEKASKALEIAARNNPVAYASLIETRMLIAEAIHSIESIDAVETTFNKNVINPSVDSAHSSGFGKINEHPEILPLNFHGGMRKDNLVELGRLVSNGSTSWRKDLVPNGTNTDLPNGREVHFFEPNLGAKAVSVTKKWVRGKLVEVAESA